MSIKLTASRTTALVATFCLMASLTITSCKKETKPAAEAVNGAAGAVGGAVNGAAGTVGGAVNGAAGTVGGAVASVGKALNPADLKAVTPAKAALTMANTAIGKGDMKAAKTQFDKFNGLWTTVSPMVKASAGDKYPAIESGVEMTKTAMSGATPDKAKAAEGMKAALAGLNAVMAKK